MAARQLISSECKCAEWPRVRIEVVHAGNDVNLPGLATTGTPTRHVNLNYFPEALRNIAHVLTVFANCANMFGNVAQRRRDPKTQRFPRRAFASRLCRCPRLFPFLPLRPLQREAGSG